jgi:hypothetical protein
MPRSKRQREPAPRHFSHLIGSTVWATLENILRQYEKQPLLGTRTALGYEWLSYGTFLRRVEEFSSGVVPLLPDRECGVGICAVRLSLRAAHLKPKGC